jgi:hypothetical protein
MVGQQVQGSGAIHFYELGLLVERTESIADKNRLERRRPNAMHLMSATLPFLRQQLLEILRVSSLEWLYERERHLGLTSWLISVFYDFVFAFSKTYGAQPHQVPLRRPLARQSTLEQWVPRVSMFHLIFIDSLSNMTIFFVAKKFSAQWICSNTHCQWRHPH